MLSHRFASLLTACVLLGGFAGSPGHCADLDQIQDRGQLIVISFPHQQSEFIRTNLELGPTPETGSADHFIGADVDLMKLFAERLGVELVFRRVSEPSYGALIPDLLAGRGDLVASSFSITAERRKLVAFSDPYFTVFPVIVTRADSDIAAATDLKGRTAAAIRGSSHEEHLLRLGVMAKDIRGVSFTLDDFLAVAEGEVDFTLVDSIAANRYLDPDSQLKVAFRLPGTDDFGYAVPRTSTALLAELNAFIAEMSESGELARIIEQHVQDPDPTEED